MIATTKDRVEVVKALVKSGAEVEHKNEVRLSKCTKLYRLYL